MEQARRELFGIGRRGAARFQVIVLEIVVNRVERAVAAVHHLVRFVQFDQGKLRQLDDRRRMTGAQQFTQGIDGFLDPLGVVGHRIVVHVFGAFDGFAQDFPVGGEVRGGEGNGRAAASTWPTAHHADGFQQQTPAQDVVVIRRFEHEIDEPILVQGAQMPLQLLTR